MTEVAGWVSPTLSQKTKFENDSKTFALKLLPGGVRSLAQSHQHETTFLHFLDTCVGVVLTFNFNR